MATYKLEIHYLDLVDKVIKKYNSKNELIDALCELARHGLVEDIHWEMV